MEMSKKYWKGIEELKQTPEFIKQKDQEFPSQQSVEDFLADENLAESSTARRDFLKFLGFYLAIKISIIARPIINLIYIKAFCK